MDSESTKNIELLGLNLLSGKDTFMHDLNPEDEASITGGGRKRSRSRSVISRSLPSRSRKRR